MSELTSLGVGELLSRLRQGAVSAHEVTCAHLDRVRSIDGSLGAFLRLNPGAEQEARAVDQQIERGEAGALAGIPVALKDNLSTRGIETTCASKILEGFVPVRDATAVARLREAGAIVLGKTNMDEFAMGSSTENSAFLRTRNPWNRERVPGGSSGGSAVAVAARLAPVALGSDTGGSVRQPAAFCGVTGLKPTYGRVSRLGLVAFGSSLDQIGPFGRSVEDVARVFEVIAGHDESDSTSARRPVDPCVEACGEGVAGLRVGLPREYFGEGLDPQIRAAIEESAGSLERGGARIEPVSLPHTEYAVPTYYLVATAEASSNLARYDGVRYGPRSADSTDMRRMYASTRSRGFGPEVRRRIMLGTYALSAGYYDQFYGKAQRVRTLLRRDFLEIFATGIDVLLTPTTPTTAFGLGDKVEDPLEMYLSDIYTATANLAGIPGLVVPIGRSRDGMPIGAQLLGPDFGEAQLFRTAAVLEHEHPIGESPTP